MNNTVKPPNPVVKALNKAPKHGGKHKPSKGKLFREIFEREIKEIKNVS